MNLHPPAPTCKLFWGCHLATPLRAAIRWQNVVRTKIFNPQKGNGERRLGRYPPRSRFAMHG